MVTEMEMSLGARLKHAWNVFTANEFVKPRWDIGPSYHYRPDRPIFSRGNERAIITPEFFRSALFRFSTTPPRDRHLCQRGR